MSEPHKTVSAMNKLYIGNLPIDTDEAAVRQLFAEHNLSVAEISIKRGGYAFVKFPDQSAADRAIDKLHGFSYCGLPLVVESSIVANKKIAKRASTTQLKESSKEDSSPSCWKGIQVTTADFSALQQDLTSFFLSALQLRSDASEKDVDSVILDKSEDEVVNALVCFVLKLSKTSIIRFYFKIYDWAIRSNIGGQKDRVITFYRLSSAMADKLKGLFVLFATHFIKNAAELLDACNKSKSEELYFNSEQKCMDLVHYIIKTLHIVFLYDSLSFINKERFETLLQPIVDQLENTLGGISSLKVRATESIMPCISQFAVATDDSLWKLLNYQVLLKTRHNDAEIRLIALECLVSMATQLGSSWLPVLAESVPFLAELLEDGDQRIKVATKDAIRKLEQILGEPLEKYF